MQNKPQTIHPLGVFKIFTHMHTQVLCFKHLLFKIKEEPAIQLQCHGLCLIVKELGQEIW